MRYTLCYYNANKHHHTQRIDHRVPPPLNIRETIEFQASFKSSEAMLDDPFIIFLGAPHLPSWQSSYLPLFSNPGSIREEDASSNTWLLHGSSLGDHCSHCISMFILHHFHLSVLDTDDSLQGFNGDLQGSNNDL